jgi:hypothetical protein
MGLPPKLTTRFPLFLSVLSTGTASGDQQDRGFGILQNGGGNAAEIQAFTLDAIDPENDQVNIRGLDLAQDGFLRRDLGTDCRRHLDILVRGK